MRAFCCTAAYSRGILLLSNINLAMGIGIVASRTCAGSRMRCYHMALYLLFVVLNPPGRADSSVLYAYC